MVWEISLTKYVSNPKHATIIAYLCVPKILRPCFTFLIMRDLQKDKNATALQFTKSAFCIYIFFSELHKIPAFQRIPCCKVLVRYYGVRNVMTFMRRNSPALKKREVLQNILIPYYWNICHDPHLGLRVSFPPFPPYATVDDRNLKMCCRAQLYDTELISSFVKICPRGDICDYEDWGVKCHLTFRRNLLKSSCCRWYCYSIFNRAGTQVRLLCWGQ
jgi:hypothetical protein